MKLTRLCTMYHAGIDDSDETEILASLMDPNGKCQLLFRMIAFGMGINILDIRYILTLRPSL